MKEIRIRHTRIVKLSTIFAILGDQVIGDYYKNISHTSFFKHVY